MTKKELVEIFEDDKRFKGSEIHDAIFEKEPSEAYDILEKIFGIDELRKIPDSVDLDFDLKAYDDFVDDLADEVSDEGIEKVAKGIGTSDIDIEMIKGVPEAVKKIEKTRTVDASDVVLFEEILKFAIAVEKKYGFGSDAVELLEELKDLADEWSVEDD